MALKTILIVDDAQSSRILLLKQLKHEAYELLEAQNGVEALELIRRKPVDLVLSDLVMPEMDGIELLETVRAETDLPFIMLTAHGTIDSAVSAMRKGADDYVTRPYNIDELRLLIERSIENRKIRREYRELIEDHERKHGFNRIITASESMREVLEAAASVARTPGTNVLIRGESGTGKELLAAAIHTASGALQTRFVGVNCAGIPSTLMESELFGYAKGAFTNAVGDRRGKFEKADEGTLLLDEIGDMPLEMQAKLLRVLDTRTYEPLGSNTVKPLGARIIAATNRDLEDLISRGKFRQDLYYRLNTYPLFLPPLRRRKTDIPLLIDHFLAHYRQEFGRTVQGISPSAMDTCMNYDWPGNVRELKNNLERAVIRNRGEMIRAGDLHIGTAERAPRPSPGSSKTGLYLDFGKEDFTLDDVIEKVLALTLEKTGQNKAEAARLLNVDRRIFYRRKKIHSV